MRKVYFYRNTKAASRINFKIARLPVRQTLIWLGPVFILVKPA
jgi:hypothetical protein